MRGHLAQGPRALQIPAAPQGSFALQHHAIIYLHNGSNSTEKVTAWLLGRGIGHGG